MAISLAMCTVVICGESIVGVKVFARVFSHFAYLFIHVFHVLSCSGHRPFPVRKEMWRPSPREVCCLHLDWLVL